MILSFWDNLREWFKNAFTHITLGNVMSLLFGVLIGLLFALLIYVVSLLSSLRKSEKENKFKKEDLCEQDEESNAIKVREYIDNSIARYDDISKTREYGEIIFEIKDIVSTLVLDIAKIYYPSSKHPLFELSIEEAMMLDRYIVEKIEGLFNRKGLRLFKKKNIAWFLSFYDGYKKIQDNRIVKEAKKFRLKDVSNVFMSIKNVINIAGWIKKGTTKLSFSIALNKLAKTCIEIIGSETAKVYSKNVFIVDEERINEAIDETEKLAIESDEKNNENNEFIDEDIVINEN